MWRHDYEKALRYKLLADYHQHKQQIEVADSHHQRYLKHMERMVNWSQYAKNSVHRQSLGRVRFLHAATRWAHRGFDLVVDDKGSFSSVPFGKPIRLATLSVRPQPHNFILFFAKDRKRPLLQANWVVLENSKQVVVVRDPLLHQHSKPVWQWMKEGAEPIIGHLKLRFAHFSPNAPVLRIIIQTEQRWAINVNPGQVTPYALLPAGPAQLTMEEPSTGKVLYSLPRVHLRSDKVVTSFILGRVSGYPALRAVFA